MAVLLAGDEVAEGQRCMREGESEPSHHAYETEDQYEGLVPGRRRDLLSA